ncbi:MAG: phosphatase PAP2 family protein [Cytophagaceae bacterium]
MKSFLSILLALSLLSSAVAQDEGYKKNSVYKLNPWVTVPVIVGGFVTNYYGILHLKAKPGLDSATVAQLSPADVNRFDRGASRQDPAVADKFMKASDIGLTAIVLTPVFLLADKNPRKDFTRISLIYLETMSIMANAYSWGVGNLNRKRPYVFNTEESFKRRTRAGSFNSFYAGHPAACAASTFFIVKVFHDYHPGSKLTPWLYGAALIPPLGVAYCRYKAGMHFPTDIIAGIAAGAFIGTIVPHLHKKKGDKKLSLYPTFNGFAMTVKL